MKGLEETPVNEFLLENSLAEGLRKAYTEKAEKAGVGQPWTLFLVACSAQLEEVRSKRAAVVVVSEEELPGEYLFLLYLFFFFFEIKIIIILSFYFK